jgi:hypothetical protein
MPNRSAAFICAIKCHFYAEIVEAYTQAREFVQHLRTWIN